MPPPPTPPIVPVPVPIQWGLGIGQLPDGSKICLLQVTQGQLTMSLQLPPHDLKHMADDMAQTAAQASSALIVPAGMQLNGNHN